jgi:hypothetical protein
MALRLLLRRSITDYARNRSNGELVSLIEQVDKVINNPIPCGRDMGLAISKQILYLDSVLEPDTRKLFSSLLLQISGSTMALEGMSYEEYIPAFRKARDLLSSLERK